MKEADKELLGA